MESKKQRGRPKKPPAEKSRVIPICFDAGVADIVEPLKNRSQTINDIVKNSRMFKEKKKEQNEKPTA